MGNSSSSSSSSLSPIKEKRMDKESLPNTIYCILKPCNFKTDELVPLVDPFHQVRLTNDLEIIPKARDKIFGNLLGVPIYTSMSHVKDGIYVQETDISKIIAAETRLAGERMFYVLKTSKYHYNRKCKSIGFFKTKMTMTTTKPDKVDIPEEMKNSEKILMVPLEAGEKMYRNKHWENFIDLDWKLCGYIRYPLFENKITSPISTISTEQVALIRFLCSCEYHELKAAQSFLEKLKQKNISSSSSSLVLEKQDLDLDELFLVPLIYDNFITVSSISEINDLDDFYRHFID